MNEDHKDSFQEKDNTEVTCEFSENTKDRDPHNIGEPVRSVGGDDGVLMK